MKGTKSRLMPLLSVTHTKYAYLMKVEGELRKKIFVEHEGDKRPRPTGDSHASLGVVYRQDEDGTVYFLTLLYTIETTDEREKTTSYQSWRFPVETGEDKETPKETMVGGLMQEIAAEPDPDKFSVAFAAEDPIVKMSLPADTRGPSGKKFGTETLGAPQYVEAYDLSVKMFERGVRFHLTALKAALNHLAQDPKVCARYQDTLVRWMKEDKAFSLSGAC